MRLSEKLLIEEVSRVGRKLQASLRGLAIGELVSTIRKQLKMSQRVLALRARVPQSTISNLREIEKTAQYGNS